MNKIEELKDKYDEHLRLGEEKKATEVLQEVNKLRSGEDDEPVEEEPEPEESEEENSFEDISGVGSELAETLADEYDSVEELAEADLEDLEPIPGIGEKRAESIIEQANE